MQKQSEADRDLKTCRDRVRQTEICRHAETCDEDNDDHDDDDDGDGDDGIDDISNRIVTDTSVQDVP
ncbi:hypothetical protein ElyMa_000487500 [Elysia marginata]|uniref:Uncharacterized protein n=1 Tax=Elysia marginata TaxID=1093978 RepID=A0AAV4FT53_9GAST|nr:hypothetical protein ElyMa_000487500 [Elysia marginata]